MKSKAQEIINLLEVDDLSKVVQAIDKAFSNKNYSDSDIYDVASDITMEDPVDGLNQASRSDLIDVIADWVFDGIKSKQWTLDGWIKDVIE